MELAFLRVYTETTSLMFAVSLGPLTLGIALFFPAKQTPDIRDGDLAI